MNANEWIFFLQKTNHWEKWRSIFTEFSNITEIDKFDTVLPVEK